MLIELGKRFHRHVRAGDVVARLGGDEFGVLISSLQRPEDAGSIAERIQLAVCEPIILPDGNVVTTSVSIGVAIFPDHAGDPEELKKMADHAMYMAKRSGKSPWVTKENRLNSECLS